jgi:hypothetical protein
MDLFFKDNVSLSNYLTFEGFCVTPALLMRRFY